MFKKFLTIKIGNKDDKLKALLSKPSKNNEQFKGNEAKKSVAGISLPSLVPLMKKEKTADEELQLELANVISEIEAQAKEIN